MILQVPRPKQREKTNQRQKIMAGLVKFDTTQH